MVLILLLMLWLLASWLEDVQPALSLISLLLRERPAQTNTCVANQSVAESVESLEKSACSYSAAVEGGEDNPPNIRLDTDQNKQAAKQRANDVPGCTVRNISPQLSLSDCMSTSTPSSRCPSPPKVSSTVPFPTDFKRPEVLRRSSQASISRKSRPTSVSLRKAIIAKGDRLSWSSSSDAEEVAISTPALSRSPARPARSLASCLRRGLTSSISSRSSSPSATPPTFLPQNVEQMLTKRLPPLPRFNPYMRTRSESMSVLESKAREQTTIDDLLLQPVFSRRPRSLSAPTPYIGRPHMLKRPTFGLDL